jgi:GYF domain 2
MYKIIGADHQEYGPSSAEELKQWIREGRADGRSLVKLEGATEWKPLASFPELAVALPESPLARKLQPPGPPPVLGGSSAADAPMPVADVDVPIGQCLRRGWDLLMSNFGLLYFAAVSVGLIQMMLLHIPLIGPLSLLFGAVFQGGVYQMFIKRARGQPAELADVYAGFGEHFIQLLLAGIVMAVLTGLGWCCCVLPGIFLAVAWVFAVPLIMDRQLRFWDALELSRQTVTKRWFQIMLLMALAFLPRLIFALCFRIATFTFVWSMYQSGQLNPSLFSTDQAAYLAQFEHMERLMAEKYAWWGWIEQAILVLVLPFARAVLVQAYEILFNPRSAPPA